MIQNAILRRLGVKQTSLRFHVALVVFMVCGTLAGWTYTFDVKVPKNEMLDLAPIANGFSYFLIEAGNAVSEVGEDYAIWLSGYRKIIRGTTASVGFMLELTEASGFRKGKKRASLTVEFEYTVPPTETITLDEPVFRFLRKKTNLLGATVATEGKEGGRAAMKVLPALLEAGKVTASRQM